MSTTNAPSTTSTPDPQAASADGAAAGADAGEDPGTRRRRLARRAAATLAKIAASQIVGLLVRRWLEHQV